MKHVKLFELFTFKTDKPTGRYKSFSNENHNIKIKGFECGSIDHESPFKIRLMVWKNDEDRAKPTDNKNCPWKSIYPSDVDKDMVRDDFDKVVWFNK